jgi:hypothetical protein
MGSAVVAARGRVLDPTDAAEPAAVLGLRLSSRCPLLWVAVWPRRVTFAISSSGP